MSSSELSIVEQQVVPDSICNAGWDLYTTTAIFAKADGHPGTTSEACAEPLPDYPLHFP